MAESETVSSIKRFRPIEDGWYAFRFRNDEVRVRATAKAERTYIEWKIGYTDGCPRGLGWAGVLTDDQHGLSNGRLYLDKHSNDTGQTYFKDSLHSIPMPKEIAESLIEDARTTEPHQLQALSES